MLVTRKNMLTGEMNSMEIEVDPLKVEAYYAMAPRHRPFVQDYFPELNAGEREFLLTGITPKEWDALFPEDE